MTSVIVACWNALELTRVCVERLLAVTDRPFELIVVDNGSTDGTGAWLGACRRRLEAGGPAALRRLVRLRNSQNRGYAAAMNRGLRAARGEFVVFANSDAAVARGWLEGMQAAFREACDAGAVAPASNPPMPHRARRPWAARPFYDGLAGLDRLAAAAALAPGPAFLPAKGFLPGFWVLTRRSVLERVGGFDERFGPGGAEDLDLQWRMARAGLRLGFARRVYVHHAWSGSIRGNGLSPRRLFARTGRAFLELHPDARAWDIDDCTYAAFLRPSGRNAMMGRYGRRPADLG